MTLVPTLDIDPASDAVTFHFHVHHEGPDPIDVQFRSAKYADVAVHEDSEEVWRWSDGQMFAQMMQTETFEPGQVETFEFEWSDPDPGDYEAVATLNTMDDVSAREPFTV